MKTPISFLYQIEKPGIASGTLSLHQQSVSFQVTNVSNPLYDLLKGMASLIFEPSHLWGEENMSWIDWYAESNGIKWVLSTEDGKQVHLKVIEYLDIFDESTGKVKIDGVCDFLDLYGAIVQRLDTFIKEMGLLNYEQQWQKDEFPITYFLLLKKHLIEKGSWVSEKIKNNTLNDEIDLLLA
ncbi:hypothetical protein DMA11_13465 [Marinilabiliaceae bacterium JC017]|nr:hypothetical protein DMA11_13465 [Marinilabiliaceae bacterium JC017]